MLSYLELGTVSQLYCKRAVEALGTGGGGVSLEEGAQLVQQLVRDKFASPS